MELLKLHLNYLSHNFSNQDVSQIFSIRVNILMHSCDGASFLHTSLEISVLVQIVVMQYLTARPMKERNANFTS